MTYVWKCKRTCSSVAWRMCGSAGERTMWLLSKWTLTSHPTPPHPLPTPPPPTRPHTQNIHTRMASYWCWHQKHWFSGNFQGWAHSFQSLGFAHPGAQEFCRDTSCFSAISSRSVSCSVKEQASPGRTPFEYPGRSRWRSFGGQHGSS